MITSAAFAGKKYAVLGLARSGAATVEALLASGAEVLAWDRQDHTRGPFEGRATLADPLETDLTGFDGVVVSPGVPLNTHPIAGHAAQYGVPVIGDIELFAQARADLPPHQVVGITGTNGKSTTTALVHHILRHAGVAATLGGNIGLPILGQEPLPSGGVYVLELSSYQIDLTRSLACEAATLLNITPDHLDRYDGFEAYAFSKGRLFTMQSAAQFAVFGSTDATTRAIYEAEKARRPDGRVALIDLEAYADLQPQWPSLQGPHNLENAAAAIALVEELGLTRAQWEAAMPSFNGLPHRMERVAEHKGVLYVNDSKATNQASAAPALAAYAPDPAINDGAPRIHWILGGLAKEDGLGECGDYIGHIAAAYTIGEAGPRFAQLLEGQVPVTRAELLSEAVKRAMEHARPGDVVLLSPACASFDQFRDYEKRGELFRQVVAALTGASAEIQDALARGDAV
ncbi:UDP-N-acetylmuramoyl-L-alanine--D-glutamate ligase [Altererythrobacter arenosus]|uniref:UDP-N-acetylmuramoylalanine--D-glutamate ligase n=1 Tax=Altererythrobacter arenosus TaxID=3032592 RepID=A0ABY8FT98_9SPHN|nr:UDP-N-acetylmuramoyl-L-alanine--D-glutamate ligase [Altererythrobacter sp. CAU 1644]WFL77992.1 UDP-N-acetylmuramoyl-L-alanine--D-glutamate ligase [Altererythrobacter sp. CAU 1644]